MYLYSGNGLTPCTDCPHDTYWVDGDDKARCEPCPIGTNTNGRGARKQEDCLGMLIIHPFPAYEVVCMRVLMTGILHSLIS